MFLFLSMGLYPSDWLLLLDSFPSHPIREEYVNNVTEKMVMADILLSPDFICTSTGWELLVQVVELECVPPNLVRLCSKDCDDSIDVTNDEDGQ
jgi:hypothetical protein